MLLKSFKNTKWEFHLSEKCRRLKTVSFIMNEPAKKSFQSFCPNVWLPWHCTRNEVLIKDFFSKCDQIRRKLWIWSHLLKKSFNRKLHILHIVIDYWLLPVMQSTSIKHPYLIFGKTPPSKISPCTIPVGLILFEYQSSQFKCQTI